MTRGKKATLHAIVYAICVIFITCIVTNYI